ncbi:lytic transglycosylase domain-containing protein [Pseudoduganella violacea]|uniref:Soluble lytic murein transglycosylase-like protein n=1 Tax=Pseudoduganella violacea TaxID=1715466 RepID=A0A7W5FSC2_9BURK|nr:transglycosylase SLT domain-containing protein [Pseudoduganella violacea]MBB3117068.1 soluble lytic murein transglycosylase-like protein [Pseudoduganella violacea]
MPVRRIPPLSFLLGLLGAAAACAQNAQVLTEQAVRHEHGEGMPRDLPQAATLYCRAARLGAPEAQYALGWMYANGRGVARSDATAGRLFALAAEQGHAQARNMLALTPPLAGAALPDCMAPDPPLLVDFEPEPEYVAASRSVRLLVDRLAPQFDIDPHFAMAVIAVESGFNAKAVSPKNAQGLMQLIPETAQRFRVKDTFDPEANIRGGLAYLQWLLACFEGNVQLVAAAYNAGEKAVASYGGVPPYAETRDYVQKIARLYRPASHPYRAGLAAGFLQTVGARKPR